MITTRRVWIFVIAAVVVLSPWAWSRWVVPGEAERDSAFAAACADAEHLHGAGMLDEARRAYVGIAAVDPRSACASGRWAINADDEASAAAAERGAVYFRAARLRLGKPLRKSSEDAFGRARNAYIEALRLDPHAAESRRELAAIIAAMGVPTGRDAANDRCAFADRLRNARLFDLARDAYAQALRSGLTDACVRYGLRLLRQDRATAEGIVRRARALDDVGREDEARPRYVAALAWDPMAPGARRALDGTEAPDPRDGTTRGHLRDMAASVGVTVGDGGTAATWVKDNADAFALGAAGVLLALPVLMWILYVVTATRRGRRLVELVHLPRFARKQLAVDPFTPPEKADTAQALFKYWLAQPLADPDAVAEKTFKDSIKGDAITDLWRAPPVPLAANFETIFAGTPASGWVALAARVAHRVSPSREVRFSGELLDGSGHGPGLRVTAIRRFHAPTDRIWWAGDLPSAPIEPEAEAEAQHALAIFAATWAHEQFGD
jgi:tetratricopeptide (TPR) repeat protein